MGQIVGQGNFFAAGSFVFINGLLQFRYIVETFLAAFRAQHFLIAAFVQNGGKDLRNGAVFISGGVALYQGYELAGFGSFKDGIIQGFRQGLV